MVGPVRPTLGNKLDSLARKLTPCGLTFLLILVSQIPFHLPGMARIAPLLPLIAVFHWAIQRPDLMPASAVFMTGLLVDLLSGAPVGVNALVLLTVYGVVVTQRRFFLGKTFPVSWLGFVLVGAGASLLSWTLVTAYYVTPMPMDAVAFQYLMSVALYPLPAWLFLRWQQVFLRTV